jgi:hypothetical protein
MRVRCRLRRWAERRDCLLFEDDAGGDFLDVLFMGSLETDL